MVMFISLFTMHRLFFMLSLLPFFDAVLAVDVRCRWKDNSTAVNYLPCNPASTRGPCCLEGETCLASGLCYGAVGLVYRGACNNEWDSISCVTYCDDKSKNWANLYPCAPTSGGSLPPIAWWCGAGSEKACTNEGRMLAISPGLPLRVLGLASEANATTPSSVSPPTAPTPSTSASSTPASSQPANPLPPASVSRGAFIGLGVGLAVLSLIIAVGGIWWLRSYKKQQTPTSNATEIEIMELKRELAARNTWIVAKHGQSGLQEMDSTRRRMELEGQKRAVELDGTHFI